MYDRSVPPSTTAPSWIHGLDEVQRAAVEDTSAALLMVAGAGTGKTRTLVARLARLIGDGVAPERVLLVTFTRRAAEEMIRRLAPLVGPEASRRVVAGTFHSVAHRLLSQHSEALGLGAGFTVIDQGDALDLMQMARQAVRAAPPGDHGDGPGAGPGQGRSRPGPDQRFPRKETLVAVYSRVANAQTPLRKVLREHFPWIQEHETAVADVFRWYTARKRADHLLDFDDLLLYWRAAALDPSAGPALARAFDHVLVDEFQDTNLLQVDVVRALHAGGCSVTAVGDDAQAIYSFRAATVDHMLAFEEQFPAGRVVRLERNYRSTQPILDLANAVLAGAEEGYGKQLWTDREAGSRPELATCPDEASEAAAVVDVVLAHRERGVDLRDQAVLFRTSHHSDLLEMELRRRSVPYVKFGGLRFLEAAHVRDLVAALRILDNPADELAWFRLLQLLDRVGPASARRIMASIGVGADPVPAGTVPADPVAALAGPADALPGPARAEAAQLGLALLDCRSDALADRPGAQIDRLRDALEPLMRRRYDDADVRLGDFDALARVAAGYGSRARMTAQLVLDPPVSTGDLAGAPYLDDDYLILSTVHSAKGGEWRAVHLIRASDGCFPSDMATGSRREIEEERRLFYVALTRAKEHLHIYAPLRFHLGGPGARGDRHSYGLRTRFLPPETDGLLAHRPVRCAREDIGLAGVSAHLHGSVTGALDSLW